MIMNESNTMKKILLISASVILSGFWALNTNADVKKNEETVNTYELLNLFGDVMEKTKTSYVEEVTDKKLIEAAIIKYFNIIEEMAQGIPP